MSTAAIYTPDFTAMCRLFNTYDSIRNAEVPVVTAFQNMAEIFLSSHKVTNTLGKTIVKMGFTANLLTDSIFFFMDFDNMGVEYYQAAKAYFEEHNFEGAFQPDAAPDTMSVIFPVKFADKTVHYRMGYICLNNASVCPLVAIETL